MSINFYYSSNFGKGNFERVKKISNYFKKKKIKSSIKKFKINLRYSNYSIFDLHPSDMKKLSKLNLKEGIIINSFNFNPIKNLINIFPGPYKNSSNKLLYYGHKYIVKSKNIFIPIGIKKKYDLFIYLSSKKRDLIKVKTILSSTTLKTNKIIAPCVNSKLLSNRSFIKKILQSEKHLISGGLTRYDLMSLGINYNVVSLDKNQHKINLTTKKMFGYGNNIGVISKYNLKKIKKLNKKKKLIFNGERNIFKIYNKNLL